MKDKTFCEICSIEVKIALLYKHINSNEHKKTENYLIRKGITYCGVCKKELSNDEWREHSISKNYFEIEKLKYCKVCKEKYSVSGCGDQCTSYQAKCSLATEYHNNRQTHKENQEFFDLFFS